MHPACIGVLVLNDGIQKFMPADKKHYWKHENLCPRVLLAPSTNVRDNDSLASLQLICQLRKCSSIREDTAL